MWMFASAQLLNVYQQIIASTLFFCRGKCKILWYFASQQPKVVRPAYQCKYRFSIINRSASLSPCRNILVLWCRNFKVKFKLADRLCRTVESKEIKSADRAMVLEMYFQNPPTASTCHRLDTGESQYLRCKTQDKCLNTSDTPKEV